VHAQVGDWGLSLSLFASIVAAIRIVVWRFEDRRRARRDAASAALEPELARVKRDHHRDPERLKQEIVRLYHRAGINPLGGCLTSLFSWLPFALIGLSVYAALRTDPALAQAPFLWLPSLGAPDPLYLLPLLLLAHGLLVSLLQPRPLRAAAARTPAKRVLVVAFMAILPAVCVVLPSGVAVYLLVLAVLAGTVDVVTWSARPAAAR